MQAVRRAAAARFTAPWDASSCSAVITQLQQQAGFAKRAGEGVDAKLQKVLKMLQPKDIEDVQLSEEDYQEGMRRHKEYTRMKMKEHRAWQADLTTKLKLKLAAVAALPPHLRAAAEVPDDEPFPLNRRMWTLTPPIEGFGKETTVTPQAGQKKFGTKHR